MAVITSVNYNITFFILIEIENLINNDLNVNTLDDINIRQPKSNFHLYQNEKCNIIIDIRGNNRGNILKLTLYYICLGIGYGG